MRDEEIRQEAKRRAEKALAHARALEETAQRARKRIEESRLLLASHPPITAADLFVPSATSDQDQARQP
jgi:hypothetical protein